MDGRRRALLSVPFGYASLHCEQGTPIPLANDLQLFNFRWQSLFNFGWQWTDNLMITKDGSIIRVIGPEVSDDVVREAVLDEDGHIRELPASEWRKFEWDAVVKFMRIALQ